MILRKLVQGNYPIKAEYKVISQQYWAAGKAVRGERQDRGWRNGIFRTSPAAVPHGLKVLSRAGIRKDC